jgi:hypothetical protein
MPPHAGRKSSAGRTTSPRRYTRCAKPPRRMTTAPASQTCCTGCRQCAPEWTPSVLPAAPARDRLRLSAAACGHSRQRCARSRRRVTAWLNESSPPTAPRREPPGRQPPSRKRVPAETAPVSSPACRPPFGGGCQVSAMVITRSTTGSLTSEYASRSGERAGRCHRWRCGAPLPPHALWPAKSGRFPRLHNGAGRSAHVPACPVCEAMAERPGIGPGLAAHPMTHRLPPGTMRASRFRS